LAYFTAPWTKTHLLAINSYISILETFTISSEFLTEVNIKENPLFPTLFLSPYLYCCHTSLYYGPRNLQVLLRYSLRSVSCMFTLNFLVCFIIALKRRMDGCSAIYNISSRGGKSISLVNLFHQGNKLWCVCSAHGKGRSIHTKCDKYDAGLCIVGCFNEHHTKARFS
jgi:hypothetical protein